MTIHNWHMVGVSRNLINKSGAGPTPTNFAYIELFTNHHCSSGAFCIIVSAVHGDLYETYGCLKAYSSMEAVSVRLGRLC